MRKVFRLLCFILGIALPAAAQSGFTKVTGTVTDPNGLAYDCGTITATIVVSGGGSPLLNGQNFSGTTSPVQLGCSLIGGSGVPGSFTMQLADNGVILPSGTRWKFTVNQTLGVSPPIGTGPQTFTFTTAINCGSNIPSTCTSNAISITSTITGASPPALSHVTGGGTPGGGSTAIQVNTAGTFGGNAAVLSLDLALDNFTFSSSLANSFFNAILTGTNSAFEVQAGSGGTTELLMDDAGIDLENLKGTANGGLRLTVNDTDNSGSILLVKEGSGSTQSSLTINNTGNHFVGTVDGATSYGTSSDGVHPSIFSLAGNTTPYGTTANQVGFMGPNTTTFTGYIYQLSATGPSAAGVLHAGAPSSGVSQLTNSPIVPGDATGSTTGSGNFVLATSPTLTTPALGTPSALVLTNATGLPLACEPGLGDGLNAVAAGTYLQSTCYNTSGKTWTLTAIKCFTDNNGTSALSATNGAGTALLTGAVTCTTAFAGGTQSGTTTIANGDFIKFSWVADGTSKQSTWVVAVTQ